jgi:hypothetical protein
LIESLSSELAKDNKIARDAAFVSLLQCLKWKELTMISKLNGGLETVRWLKQFGEQTEGMTLQEINDKLFAEGELVTIARHKQNGRKHH